MIALIRFLESRSKLFLIILGLLFVIFQGAVDYLSGDFSLLIFDLIPIFMVTWFAGKLPGILISLASATSWFIIDVITTPGHSHPLVHYWNLGVKIIFFMTIVYVLLELKKALFHEKELARVDYLTGALNVRAFAEFSQREMDLSRRHKRPFTLAYIDLDNFKMINDRFGHNLGDKLLHLAVETIKGSLRTTDVVARLGGDEFAIFLPETGYESAGVVVNRIKDTLTDVMRQNGWPVTFSIGVATYLDPIDSVDGMIRKADGLMYSAKNCGKNTIKYEVLGG